MERGKDRGRVWGEGGETPAKPRKPLQNQTVRPRRGDSEITRPTTT